MHNRGVGRAPLWAVVAGVVTGVFAGAGGVVAAGLVSRALPGYENRSINAEITLAVIVTLVFAVAFARLVAGLIRVRTPDRFLFSAVTAVVGGGEVFVGLWAVGHANYPM
jgi:hypothetical protein